MLPCALPSRRDQITMSDDELRSFLAEHRVVTCATIGPNGRPHLMPLWYAVDGVELRGWTYAKSQKAKNLERDPRATLQVEDGELYHELRGVMMECDVEIERDPEVVAGYGRELFARFGVSITYIEQDAPLGLAHAVLTAEPFIGDSPFVMYLGDNLLRHGIADLVDEFRRNEPDALILLTPVDDPQHYGVAELNGDRVKRLVEKPKDPPSDLALVGVYMFTSAIFDAGKAIEPSARGELEITDAIQHLVDTGKRVDSHIVHGWWKDTGQVQDMLDANRLILDDIQERIDGELVDSRVEGRVVVENGAKLERATVRGPAIIGAGAVLRDAYIGPYTAIGPGVRIEGAEVEYSIVLEGSSIQNLEGRIEASLVGKNVAITRSPAMPRAYRFVVGDNAEIEIL